MAVGRTTQVTVGANAFDVSTKLHTGNVPTIETLVSNRGQIVFRTSLPLDDLEPVAHGEEIRRRVEAQHTAVVDKIRGNGVDSWSPSAFARLGEPPKTPALESSASLLEGALSHMGQRNLELAEKELRSLLDGDPGFAEAEELLEIVVASRGQKSPPVTSLSDRLRAGAEALTRGWKSSAIQNWARGLSADPANRIFQLLVLLTTTPSSERRSRYLKELLAVSKRLLAEGRSEEAHALLLALQAIENPEGVSLQPPQAVPATSRHLKPTDTQPTTFHPGRLEEVAASRLVHEDTAREVEDERRPEEEEASHHRRSISTDVARTEGHDPADDDDGHGLHPERTAALFEASRAEWEAANKQGAASPRSPMSYLSQKAIWKRLGARHAIGLAVAALLIVATTGLLGIWSSKHEEGGEELARAAALAAGGQFRQAITVYDRLLARGQLQTLAYLGRGRARLAAGEAEAGLSDLTRATELAPESVEILEEMADGLYSRGRFAKAVDYYTRTIALGRDTPDVRYRLAGSLVQLDRVGEALPHLEIAIAREASHGEARYLYGKLLNELGRHAEAEMEIRGARSLFDPGADYFVELAIALLEQGKLDGAEELARKLERHDPSDARAHALLGEIYLGRQRLEAARNELIQSLQTNAEQPRAHLALARVWLAFGRTRRDPADFLKARQILEAGHGIPEGKRLLALGKVSLSEGNPENAIHLLEDALTHGCDRLPARLALAEARFAVDDLAGAVEELEAADILAPSDAAIALSLGVVHSVREDFLRASKEYLKALHRVGLSQPVQESSGPVMLPSPYLALPSRFDVNRAIGNAYRRALSDDAENEIALALRNIAESTSFLIGGRT